MRRLVLFLVPMLGLLTGCPPGPGPFKPDPEPQPQPVRSMREIRRVIDSNAARLDRALWSNTVSIVARFNDEAGKEHRYSLEGSLFFRKPRDLLMNLNHGLGIEVMQIGSNPEEYWLWIEPELRKMWWGKHEHSGKSCVRDILVKPGQLISALGVGGLPSSDEGLIGPSRKFGKKSDILYYLREQEDGFRIAREYWVERVPPYLVRVVNVRDRMGRISMSANLDDFRSAWEGGPQVAHEISILWPLTGGTFACKMSRVRGVPAEQVRDESLIRPTGEKLPNKIRDNIMQVDADCDR